MAEYLAKITAKGQMTLPIEVRKALGVEPGDHVRIAAMEGGGCSSGIIPCLSRWAVCVLQARGENPKRLR